jgi:chromosome segregation ATPase
MNNKRYNKEGDSISNLAYNLLPLMAKEKNEYKTTSEWIELAEERGNRVSGLEEVVKAGNKLLEYLENQLKAKDKEIEELKDDIEARNLVINSLDKELERLKEGVGFALGNINLERDNPIIYKELEELLKQ